MNRCITIEGTSIYKLNTKIDEFLIDNPNIQVISHSVVLREYKVTSDVYSCIIIYKI